MSEIHTHTVMNICDAGDKVTGTKVYQTREALRDQFAGQAMQLEMAIQGEIIAGGGPVEEIAKLAYEQADAMLAAREKGQQ